MAKLLWAFDFACGKDAKGKNVPVDMDARTGYSEGFLCCPKDFAVDVKVRSDSRRRTIMAEFEKAEREVFSLYDDLEEENERE